MPVALRAAHYINSITHVPNAGSEVSVDNSDYLFPIHQRQMATPFWPPQFCHGFRFDLTDALAGYSVDPADLVQRLGMAVGQPEPHCDYTSFTFTKAIEYRVKHADPVNDQGALGGRVVRCATLPDHDDSSTDSAEVLSVCPAGSL